MKRLRGIGVRPRLIAALVLTSAFSLAVAAAGLLPQLQSRLRDDQATTLVAVARSVRPSFTRLEADEAARGSPALARLARRLGRRAEARVGIIDANGTLLAGTDAEVPDLFSDAKLAIARNRVVRAAGPSEGDELEVAVPTRAAGRPIALALRRSSNDARLATQVVQRAFLPAALAALALAATLGFALSRGPLRRLQRLHRTALTVADTGPVVEMRADASRDEIGDLGRALATMQRNLQRQEEARRTFVATASHELRTPISSLAMMLELLDEGMDSNGDSGGDMHVQVRRAREQTTRLAGLASNLLDLSSLDAGVPLRSEPVDVLEVCRAVAAEFGGVHLDAPSEGCWAHADPGAVAQVLRILLDNARRVTPPGGAATVAVAVAGDSVEIAVCDDGPGVEPAESEAIFERFRRGANAGDGGFGLGLAIGRELAARMDGELRLASTGPGARFVLALPAEPALEG